MKQSLKQSFDNLKGRRVYQFILDEKTGKIEDISDSFDYVKVVRCKDCKHRDPEDHKCDCGHDIIWQTPRPDDFYCADGERKPDKEKQYFPKGFFSKERPLAKGEEDETD